MMALYIGISIMVGGIYNGSQKCWQILNCRKIGASLQREAQGIYIYFQYTYLLFMKYETVGIYYCEMKLLFGKVTKESRREVLFFCRSCQAIIFSHYLSYLKIGFNKETLDYIANFRSKNFLVTKARTDTDFCLLNKLSLRETRIIM